MNSFAIAGVPLRSTLDNTTTAQYGLLMEHLVKRTQYIIRDLAPTDEFTFMRILTKKHEIMLAYADEFFIIVLQNPISEND